MICRGFRQAAAPAYEACRWPARDAENREWIANVIPQLETHEEAIAARLAQLYRIPLGGLPIRVDVMETVNWSGATTILFDAGGGHIQISTPDRGPRALELLFHEATHTLMGRQHPVQLALQEAAERLEVERPRDLWHAVQFFQTGEAVRSILEEAGEEAYEPMMFALDIFGKYHEVLKAEWTGYLNGRASLEEAAEALLRAVGETAE